MKRDTADGMGTRSEQEWWWKLGYILLVLFTNRTHSMAPRLSNQFPIIASHDCAGLLQGLWIIRGMLHGKPQPKQLNQFQSVNFVGSSLVKLIKHETFPKVADPNHCYRARQLTALMETLVKRYSVAQLHCLWGMRRRPNEIVTE